MSADLNNSEDVSGLKPNQVDASVESQFDPQLILDAMAKVADAGGLGNILTVKGLRDAINPVKIGELFGMEVWSDPLMPPDVSWYISKEKLR